ncbi:MAG: exopolyphosphatase [Gammaproteobacteria bacterium]|nr:MAG: exopolyphosphatase [Gammaproteobacteria bacterium]
MAAVDLGSNSFHLLVAQESDGVLQVVDRIKEMVRLADGLDEDKMLNAKVVERALDCLDRFSQRLRGLAPEDIRVVGTNTLRRATNAQSFLDEAERLLGTEVEIISGREEARLIYLGVSHALEDTAERRLVVDIGGGSTELILGKRFRAEVMESLHMGCVGMTQRCFGDGKLRASQFKDAINLARQELEPVEQEYRESGWDLAIGASGTILAVQDILSELNPDTSDITLNGLKTIKKALIDTRQIDRINLPGLPSERAPVFAGGLAVLHGIFESLNIEKMQATSGALREGLIYDLLGRVQHQDVRETTIRDLVDRYHIEPTHGRRVRETAIGLLAQAAMPWKLTEPTDKLLIGWAADLHEIGMDIAHSQYHKHGGYLLENMDMAGFSRLDQHHLAVLVRAHRRKFPVDDVEMSTRLRRLAVLLRLSVVLHRSRTGDPLPHVSLKVRGNQIKMEFPDEWLSRHPLTQLDLEQEASYLKAIDHTLTVVA